MKILIDDLSSQATAELIDLHVRGMLGASPPGHSFALAIDGLRTPGITVWRAERNGRLAGIVALNAIDKQRAELKSMRTHPDFLRQGVAAALLAAVVSAARERGFGVLSLETGTGAQYEAAVTLYRRHGFVAGDAFGDYVASDFNQFFHLDLDLDQPSVGTDKSAARKPDR